jgi:hypothetical protein
MVRRATRVHVSRVNKKCVCQDIFPISRIDVTSAGRVHADLWRASATPPAAATRNATRIKDILTDHSL